MGIFSETMNQQQKTILLVVIALVTLWVASVLFKAIKDSPYSDQCVENGRHVPCKFDRSTYVDFWSSLAVLVAAMCGLVYGFRVVQKKQTKLA